MELFCFLISTTPPAAKAVKLTDANLVFLLGVTVGALGVLASSVFCLISGLQLKKDVQNWHSTYAAFAIVLTVLLSLPYPVFVWWGIADGTLKQVTQLAVWMTSPVLLVAVFSVYLAWRLIRRPRKR